MDSTDLEGKEIFGLSFSYLRGYELSGEQSLFPLYAGVEVGWKIISSLHIILRIPVGTRQHGTARVRGLCLSPDGSEIRRTRLSDLATAGMAPSTLPYPMTHR